VRVSSTNRGRERQPASFYPTHPKYVAPLLVWLEEHGYRFDTVYDPCAGEGHILQAAADRGYRTLARELREECEPALRAVAQHVEIGDALVLPVPDLPTGAVVSNNPFTLNLPLISRYRDCGVCASFLAPLNLLGGKERRPWWLQNRPAHQLTLDSRPAFMAVCKGRKTATQKVRACDRTYPLGTRGACECGGLIGDGTDSCNYAWLVYSREPRAAPPLDWLEVRP
jgi:hypothetical protein